MKLSTLSTHVVPIASLIVAIACMVLTYMSIQVSKQLAESSGTLDKSSMEVGIGGNPLALGRENYVLVGASTVSKDVIPVIGAIPFTFSSVGKKSLDSISISFQYHEVFQRKLLELTEFEITGAFSSAELKKATSEGEKRFFVSYSLPTLNPGVNLRIAEPLFLEEHYIRTSVPVTTKDNVNIDVSFEAKFAKNFGLAVSSRDSPVLGYSVSVDVQKVNSIHELFEVHARRYISDRQRKLRKDLGAFSYLIALLTSSPSQTVFLVHVPVNKITTGEHTIYSPMQQQKVIAVKYPMLSLALLYAGSQ